VARLTDVDWGKIHARAWLNPEFRKLLESDPTAAIREYEKVTGKKPGHFDKIVRLTTPPPPSRKSLKSIPEEVLQRAAPWPPWCC
jgi:hypothetical protein